MSRIFNLALEDHSATGSWAELEAKLGFEVPQTLKDGIDEGKLQYEGFRFFTVQEILARYTKCREDWDSGCRVRMMTISTPHVNRAVWNQKWVEIAERIEPEFPEYPSSQRDTIAVDFDPAEEGEYGQVIHCGHTTDRTRVTSHYENLIRI